MGRGAQEEDKSRVAMVGFVSPSIKGEYWVGSRLGSFLALTSSLALFLQVVVSLLSSSSPQRVRWMIIVLTYLVQGPGVPSRPGREQASGVSGPGPAGHVFRVAQPPLLFNGSRAAGFCSQPLKSAGSSVYCLCGLGQHT